MSFQTQLFTILLVVGIMMVGAEVFLPGGVLGALGGLCLAACIIVAFQAFGFVNGSYIAVAIVVLVGAVIALWIKIFPRTWIGRKMIISGNLSLSKATEPSLNELLGREGESASELRPAGFATIGGRRVDVVTEGGMISRGDRIRVVMVEGNRVVVRKMDKNERKAT